MALREEFEKIGNWFFRWRSYLPLVLTIIFIFGLKPTAGGNPGIIAVKEVLFLAVSFVGLWIRAYAVGCAPKGTSGRNVKEQRAESLNTTGLYSVVRHPLYLGNLIIWIGIGFFVGAWWVVPATILIFWLYYEKMMFAEEEFLRRQYGEQFLKWSHSTSAFLPLKWDHWKPPALPFRFKNALRREYSGFFGIVSVFSLMKLIKDTKVAGTLVVDGMWLSIFLIALAIYLSLMYLKKKTTFLNIEGM